MARLESVSHLNSDNPNVTSVNSLKDTIVKKVADVGEKRIKEAYDPYGPPSLTEVPIVPFSPPSIGADIVDRGVAIVDQLNAAMGAPEYGHKSTARLLLNANKRMSKSVEGIITAKKRRERKKSRDMDENVATQSNIINSQGWWKTGGTSTALLPFLGLFVAPQAQEAFSFIGRLGQGAADAMTTFKDAPMRKLAYDQTIHTQGLPSDKQALEGFKRLPDEVRNLILELARLERQVWESLARVGG